MNEIQQVETTSVIGELESAAVIQQLDAAHKYPQHRTTAMKVAIVDDCIAECTSSYDVAVSCHYSLPRGGKSIEGPSIHMLRSVGSRYGNIATGSRIISIEDKVVRAQGACWDMENNVRKTVEVSRRITKSNGDRFDDDMINVTCQAALSIAERNAMKAVIPMSIWGPVYDAVQDRLVGEAGLKDNLGEVRRQASAWFKSRGVSEELMLAKVGCKSMSELTATKLKDLGGIRTRINQEDTTIEEQFPELDGRKPESKPKASTSGRPKATPNNPGKNPEVDAASPKIPADGLGNPMWESLWKEYRDSVSKLNADQKKSLLEKNGLSVVSSRVTSDQLNSLIAGISELSS